MSWFARNWRKIAGYTCAVGTTVLAFTPLAAAAIPVGALCATLLTSEYHEGQRVVELATPAVRAVRDAVAVAKAKPAPKPTVKGFPPP